jgi:hypothetical protein
MKLMVLFIVAPFTLFFSCNSMRIQHYHNEFPNECYEAYRYFRKHLKRKKSGIFLLKDNTEEEKNQLTQIYHETVTKSCWSLYPKDVNKLFGQPHQVYYDKFSKFMTFCYFIKTDRCPGLEDLTKTTYCGRLCFEFKEDGTPTGSGTFQVLHYGREGSDLY